MLKATKLYYHTMLFENKQDFIKVLDAYRGKVFKEAVIPQELLMLFIDYYVNQQPMLTKNIFLANFISIMIKHYLVPKINIKSRTPLGKGTFGNIYETDRDDEVIKTIKNPDSDMVTGKLIHSSFDISENGNILTYASELFTFIIWISVFRYIDDLSKHDTSGSNIDILINSFVEIYKPYIIVHSDISSALAEPFISTTIPIDKYKDTDFTISFGYSMKKYKSTLHDYIRAGESPAINLLKLASILKNINTIIPLGIDLSHRDLNLKNVMINDSSIVLIDFGHAVSRICFRDGRSFSHGWFFEEYYNTTIEPSYDIVFLILYILRTYPETLDDIKMFDKFMNLICYEANFHKIVDKPASTLWLYPYIAYIYDRNKLIDKFIAMITANIVK
jgi:hypothetical protein